MNRTAQIWTACFLAVLFLLLVFPVSAQKDAYDPLEISEQDKPDRFKLAFFDKQRKRKIPLYVYLPAEKRPSPVILFSHGLGGSCKGNQYLGSHWGARGYAVVYVQHPGSDDSVWRDKPKSKRLAALKKAASFENFYLRVKDIPAVLDRLERWNNDEDHVLNGRLDLKRVGMSGHSFGAITTQAVSGQRTRNGKALFTDPRIKAALMLSPSSPRRSSSETAFGHVNMPWMLMTGTKDISPVGNAGIKSRLAVFSALPPDGNKYELVLFGADHFAFTDREIPGMAAKRNPNHHRVILALSTAFWDTWLKRDPAARAWLHGKGPPQSLLEEKDRWRMK